MNIGEVNHKVIFSNGNFILELSMTEGKEFANMVTDLEWKDGIWVAQTYAPLADDEDVNFVIDTLRKFAWEGNRLVLFETSNSQEIEEAFWTKGFFMNYKTPKFIEIYHYSIAYAGFIKNGPPERHEYSYKPNWEIVNPSGSDRLFGIELECEFDNENYAEQAAWAVTQMVPSIVLKEDGSLHAPSFEAVTQPADFRSAVDMVYEVVDTLDFEGGDTSYECGMHVHVSRKAFGSFAVSNLIVMVDNIWDDLYRFSRRDEDELHWCSNRLEYTAGAPKAVKKQAADEAAIETRHNDRYHAINVTNKDTVEFRIFKGTTDTVQAIANLQLADVLVDLANSKDGFETSWCDVIHHAAICGYNELLEKEFEMNETKENENYVQDNNSDIPDEDIPW